MEASPDSLVRSDRLRRATVIEVVYPAHRGTIGLRGSHAPLSWTETTKPTATKGNLHVFELAIPDGEMLDVKLVRGEDEWAHGRNYTIHAGDHLHLEPAFERTTSRLLDPVTIDGGPWPLSYRVLLPPSYDEQETKRYPVLYAQDGQSLWTTSSDPFGIWKLDATIDRLLELGAIEELIVVAIDTAEARLDRLGPVPDPEFGGGQAARHLEMITTRLSRGSTPSSARGQVRKTRASSARRWVGSFHSSPLGRGPICSAKRSASRARFGGAVAT